MTNKINLTKDFMRAAISQPLGAIAAEMQKMKRIQNIKKPSLLIKALNLHNKHFHDLNLERISVILGI
jgi:hypothetical protein